MDKDPYQHIHQATDKRLAEMLRIESTKTRFFAQYMSKMADRVYAAEMAEKLDEAARRLENYQPREIFNHEAFE